MIARRLRHVLSSLATLVAVAAIAGAPPVVLAAQGLTLTTDYPAVTVRPDSQVSLDLAVDTSAPARINLSLSGTPSGWTAELHGGGFVIGAVQTNGSDPTAVRLDIDVPADASGTERIVVAAFDATSRVELPIDITVTAQAGGEVSISTDFNALRGAAGASFTFNLNISNETEEDLTYSSTGQGPALWTVDAKPSGQSQAVSGTVLASGTAGVTVTVDAPDGATAGTYDLLVVTTVGTEQIETPLQVEITGSYGLTVSTESGALSGRGPAGGVTTQTFTVENTGTAPVTGVEVTASKPGEWEVTLDPATIPSIAPGEVVNVTAQITPSGNAISGDYELTITARGEEANDAAEIRFTVEASILGAVIGAALIIAAFGGLWWVFRRYGRR